jgi:hypothetical protein
VRIALRIRCLAVGGLIAAAAAAVATEPAVVLDDGATPAAWRALASDDVTASVAPAAGTQGGAVRLRFDFNHRSGFAAADRALPLDLPENFEIEVALAGDVGGNDLEFKLIDASGDNVWWYRRPAFDLAGGGRVLRIRRRQIEFAWGPASDHALRHVERLQLVVSASKGGAGVLDIGAIRLVPLPPPPATWPPAVGRAGDRSVAVPDGSAASDWDCMPTAAAACALTVDWQLPREFGGVRLEWRAERRPSAYELGTSLDGATWHVVRRAVDDGAAVDWVSLPDTEARYLRLIAAGASSQGISLHRLELEDPAFGADPNRLVAAAAREQPRGQFPRGVSEQNYWTLVGVDAGRHSGLLSEDGALETDVSGPSIEPFVVDGGRLTGWADVAPVQRLAAGYLPIPSVTWRSPSWTLEVTAFAAGDADGRLYGRYRLRNLATVRRRLTLVLALRPFQVNPPAQFLATQGGVARIDRLTWNGASFRTDRGTVVRPLRAPDRVAAFRFGDGALPARLARPDWGSQPAQPVELADEQGLASGAMAFDLDLPAGSTATVGVLVPWGAPGDSRARGRAGLEGVLHAVAAGWRRRLGSSAVAAPDAPEATQLAAALRTAEAHLLLSRRGAALRPGTRSYARSWIRDGAMMAAALLRLGETRAPEDYLRWYAGFLFANGKVPCCVDERGADPVPEHDSAGEFIYLAAEVYRRGGDRRLVASVWPQLRAAADYLDGLRRSTRTPPASGAAANPYFGLLPPSISHEGYSAKPMHSYWDDFWGLRGLSDAAFIARALGHSDDAGRLERARGEFAADVAASIAVVTATRHLDFIPGAADLGDFDATSTTVALAPGPGPIELPAGLLQGTFARYWQEFVARRDGVRPWEVYTPYEWRVVGSLVRLGERERALAALRWFMADRRPLAWNQWPEVSGREPRVVRFIGDLPHGWVASDFIRSTLDLLGYERDADQALVLAAGVPLDWLDGRGLTVRLRTLYGPVGYRMRRVAGGIDVELARGPAAPPGGYVVRVPGPVTQGTAFVNGRPEPFRNGEIHLRRAPARVRINGY